MLPGSPVSRSGFKSDSFFSRDSAAGRLAPVNRLRRRHRQRFVEAILHAIAFAEAERNRNRERVPGTKADQKKPDRFLGGTAPFGWQSDRMGH
jgi:hypothetical protein